MTNKSLQIEDNFPFAVPFSWVGIEHPVRGVDASDSQSWAEAMSNIIEYFGLPGDRYKTRFDSNHIVFLFRQEQDAAICILKFK